MTGERAGSAGRKTHEYREGEYLITCMATGYWLVTLRGPQVHDADTLREARAWCRAHPAEEQNR